MSEPELPPLIRPSIQLFEKEWAILQNWCEGYRYRLAAIAPLKTMLTATIKRIEEQERELAEVRTQRLEEWEGTKAIIAEREALRAQLEGIRAVINEQVEDDGLWFLDARTAPEAYLQQELRRLHAAIKGENPSDPLAGKLGMWPIERLK